MLKKIVKTLVNAKEGYQTLGENIDTLDSEDLIKAYIIFSKNDQLEYLYKFEKDELLLM
mgnify:CR=1 FL=1